MSVKENVNNVGLNAASDFENLKPEDQIRTIQWIEAHCIARKTVNRCHTSYGLKHILEADTGLYLHNGQFKGAMMRVGHMPIDRDALNWHFRIRRIPMSSRGGTVQK